MKLVLKKPGNEYCRAFYIFNYIMKNVHQALLPWQPPIQVWQAFGYCPNGNHR